MHPTLMEASMKEDRAVDTVFTSDDSEPFSPAEEEAIARCLLRAASRILSLPHVTPDSLAQKIHFRSKKLRPNRNHRGPL